MADADDDHEDTDVSVEDDRDERQCKIVVSGLPPNADTEDVEDFFESEKRTGGGPIRSIDYDEDNHTAVIEFENPDTVDSILQHLPIRMSKTQLEVKRYEETTETTEAPKKLLVTNIPKNVEEDDLEMFFENVRKTGGGPVASIVFDKEQGSAIIEFEEPANVEEDLDKIAIFNLPDGVDEEFIETFFESKRRPFAGIVSSVDVDEEKKCAVVQFESEETVEKIMDNLPITMMKTEIDVQRYSLKAWQNYKSDKSEEKEQPPTTVLLQNLPKNTSRDFLELFFENPNHGGEINDINYEEGSDHAIIDFVERVSVEQLLKKQSVNFRGTTVTVEQYIPIPVHWNTIEVHGGPHVVTEETMQMYFENPSRSGGCDIDNIRVTEGAEESVAYITFSSEEVAKAVSERHHVLMKSPLKVTLQDPYQTDSDGTTLLKDGKDRDIDQYGTGTDSLEKTNDTVKVKGVNTFKSPDPVKFYFENKRKSGGGTILDFSMCEDKDEAVIKFESSEVAQAVVERQHTVGSHALTVSMYTPPMERPCYPQKLLVKGVGSETSEDCLLNFLEAKSGVIPNGFMYGEEEGAKLVTFDVEPDADRLQSGCQRTPLEGQFLTVSRVPISNCIRVSNIDESTAAQTIELYFENSKRSGGGPVEKVEMNNGYCLVFFENHEDIDDVMKREHSLMGHQLQVDIFHECLGENQGEGFQPTFCCPDHVILESDENNKLTFLKNSKTYRDTFEAKMKENYALLTWPEDSERQQKIKVECLLTFDVANSYALSRTWKDNVLKAFGTVLDEIIVESITVSSEIWPKVNEFLSKINIEDPTMALVTRNSNRKTILVTGQKKPATELSIQIKDILHKAEQDCELEKKTKSHTIQLDELKVKAFVLANLKHVIESQAHVTITVDQKKNEVCITGQQENVSQAGMLVYQHSGEYAVRSVPMPTHVMSLLEGKPVQEFMDQEWRKKNITAVWRRNENSIDVCVLHRDKIDECVDVLKLCFHKKEITLEDSATILPNSEKWTHMVATLETNQSKKFVISTSELPKLTIVCTQDVKKYVHETINAFLEVNKIIVEEVVLPSSVAKFVSKHIMQKVGHIAKRLKEDLVKIQIDSKNRIFISGNKTGVEKGKQQLQELTNKIQKQKLKLSRPGLAIHMQTPDGQRILGEIERDLPCVIEVEDQHQQKETDADKAQIKESFHLKDGRVIDIYQGDITDLKVDSLICAADKKLKLPAGLGKHIMTKGGVDIRNECKRFIHNNKELKEGQVLTSTSGALCCKEVFFINGPEWKGGSQNEKRRMEDVVVNALTSSAKGNTNTIAIPAICCGKSGFPMEVGTRTIVEALKKYLKSNPRTPIRKVFLADVNQPTVENFSEATKVIFSNAQHFMSQGSNSESKSRPKSKPTATVKVTVVKGLLAKQEVDVIINTTASNLDLMQGNVSTSILKDAGQEIQTEINKEYPKGIEEGQLAYTKGYKLKCDMVMHTSLYSWDNPRALKTMKRAMSDCLAEAHRHEYSSIAFPVFGTGSLGYPPDQVAKAMFETVLTVTEKLPECRVDDVRFVIYEKDTSYIEVFEEEQKKWKGKLLSSSIDNDSDDDDDFDIIKAHGVYNIGSMILEVKTGDLAKETCACIVNSTDTRLDMTRGAVAKALLKGAGPELVDELNSKKAEMRAQHMIMTEGYRLDCDKIIHVDAPYSDSGWKEMMVKCLHLAEKSSLSSIAFPAIGSGLGMKTEDIAKLVFAAITDFQIDSPVHIKEVRFVLFNDTMFEEFCDIVDSALEHKSKGIFSSLWSGLTNMFLTKEQSQASPLRRKRKRSEDTVNLTIYSESDSVINDVSQRFKSMCDDVMLKKKISRPILTRLDESQMNDIEMVCQQHHVSFCLNVQDGSIELDGIVNNTYDAANGIYDILREADAAELSNTGATAVVIQWYYMDTSGQLCKYDAKQNREIEDCYKASDGTIEFKDQDKDGHEFIAVLDFMLMQQYDLRYPKVRTTVIRRDLLRESTCSAPEHWAPSQDALSEHELTNTDNDFNQISEMFMDSSGGGYTILSIKRIQNMTLWQQYQTKKNQLEKQNPQTTLNERNLWHGTEVSSVGNINSHGFNRSYCGKNATAFGSGVYFAMKAVTACNSLYAKEDTDGSKRVYFCRVLTGEFCQGTTDAKVPPPKPSGGPVAMFDSLVDDIAKPAIFVIFNDTQAYPEYLITFKRAV